MPNFCCLQQAPGEKTFKTTECWKIQYIEVSRNVYAIQYKPLLLLSKFFFDGAKQTQNTGKIFKKSLRTKQRSTNAVWECMKHRSDVCVVIIEQMTQWLHQHLPKNLKIHRKSDWVRCFKKIGEVL